MTTWGLEYWFTCPFCGAFIKQAKHGKDWLDGPVTCTDPECGAVLDYAKAEEVENLPNGDYYDDAGKGFSI